MNSVTSILLSIFKLDRNTDIHIDVLADTNMNNSNFLISISIPSDKVVGSRKREGRPKSDTKCNSLRRKREGTTTFCVQF